MLKKKDIVHDMTKKLNTVSGLSIRVGVFGTKAAARAAAASGKATVGAIAKWQEKGTRTKDGRVHIPARSFIGGWYDANKKELRAFITRTEQLVVAGKLTPEIGAKRIGEYAVGGIRERIASNIPPPLSPATIRAKGSSVALIDTNQLRSSITYR